MEALVDFCKHKTFMIEMYANLGGDITWSNVFEDSANLLSKKCISCELPFVYYAFSCFECLDCCNSGMTKLWLYFRRIEGCSIII